MDLIGFGDLPFLSCHSQTKLSICEHNSSNSSYLNLHDPWRKIPTDLGDRMTLPPAPLATQTFLGDIHSCCSPTVHLVFFYCVWEEKKQNKKKQASIPRHLIFIFLVRQERVESSQVWHDKKVLKIDIRFKCCSPAAPISSPLPSLVPCLKKKKKKLWLRGEWGGGGGGGDFTCSPLWFNLQLLLTLSMF